MKLKVYCHRHVEKEIVASIRHEIEGMLNDCRAQVGAGTSKVIRREILTALMKLGWSGNVVIDTGSKISITSVKSQVGLCLQTGNMGRMYADLLKLQAMYLRNTIRAGVLIVASKGAAKQMGTNVVNFDRLVRELPIFERVITIPVLVIGIHA